MRTADNRWLWIAAILALAVAGRALAAAEVAGVEQAEDRKPERNYLSCGFGRSMDKFDTGVHTSAFVIEYGRSSPLFSRGEGLAVLGFSRFFESGAAYAVGATYDLRLFLSSRLRRGFYVAPGFGVLYTNLDENIVELDRSFNFQPQLALGVKALAGKRALTIEYRYHHISNAGTKGRNLGLNSNVVLLGFSF